MEKVECEIIGVVGLLQHKFRDEEHGANVSKSKKKTYVPEEEAGKALYHDENGVYEPSEHILGALIKAGTNFKYEGKKTFKDIIKAGIVVEPENIPLLNEVGKVFKTWDEIDARGAVVQRARIIRWRPKFNKWKMRFQLSILNDDQMNSATLKEILEYAGRLGIGDYRPRFGRFTISSWQKI